IRIEQWILLALRCAIPVLLALAMARPIWQGAARLLGNAKTSTIVLLDNSYSMEAGRAGTSNYALARDEAARIVGGLKAGSQASVILMGEGGAGLIDKPTYETGRLVQQLNKSDAGFGAATVPAALDFAANTFGEMNEPVRQLVMLTDFQRVSFPPQDDAMLEQMLGRVRNQAAPPSVTFFDVGAEVKDNVAIESLDFSRLVVGVGQKIRLRANLRNFGDAKWPDLRVLFKIDGKDISVSQVNLGPRESGQVLFTHAFDTAGSHVVEITAEADTLKADNTFLASIPVRDRIPLLLVNGDPKSEPLKGETDFAEIALQPFGAAKVESADLIQTQTVKPEELNGKLLNSASVVILANVRQLSDGQVNDLESFVKTGGGLMIFTGDRVDAGWWNGAMVRDGKGLLPLALGALAGDAGDAAPSVGIVGQRFENPALDLFNDPRNGSLTAAALKLWYPMKEPDDPSLAADSFKVLARLDSGDPFLVEKTFGEGRVIACATALDADWSNLPMRPFYLPLLQRLSVYLASSVYPPRNLDVSQPVVAFLPLASVDQEATVFTPGGEAVKVKVVKKGDRGVVEFTRTRRPGLYVVEAPGSSRIHYVVNANRRESDLAKLSDTEIADLAKQHGAVLVRSGAEFKELESTRRYGRELWKIALWVLLGLVFLELILQQKFAGVWRRSPSGGAA
ncbi:MAG: VWA domain-containing protein, partial [Chthoniobacteraceae bacterium]